MGSGRGGRNSRRLRLLAAGLGGFELAPSNQRSRTLPLRITPALGGYANGTPLLTGYFPLTRVGEPRVEGYTLSRIDLLFRWDFRPAR